MVKMIVLATTACILTLAGAAISQSARHRPPRSKAVHTVRDVDFRNFDFGVCDYGPRAVLRKGRHQYGDTSLDSVQLRSVRYVDLNGDGAQEAFVVLDWSTSGSAGGGVNAYVFAMRAGSPTVVWSRCQERSGAVLAGKTIHFNYPEYVGDDAHCCPSYLTTDTYAWRGRGLARISKKRKRSGY